MGRNEIKKEEEGFPVGPQEEQKFRGTTEPDVFTEVRSGRVSEDRCQKAFGFVSVE